MQLRVGQYNLLSPTYGVKWGEREACIRWVSKADHGGSNWTVRWPALLRNISVAQWDLLGLQEIEDSTRSDVETGLNSLGLCMKVFSHPGRLDSLGLAYNPQELKIHQHDVQPYPAQSPKSITGRVDFLHRRSGRPLRVAITHQRGGDVEQLKDTLSFVFDAPSEFTCILCGDMNEEFSADDARLKAYGLTTLQRDVDAGESSVSRPPHKQQEGETSGKGKVDYILVRPPLGTHLRLERDEGSRNAIIRSHAPCEQTGEWPSDHGMEALTLHVRPTGTDELITD